MTVRYYRKMLFTFLSMALIYTVLLDAIFLVNYRRFVYHDFALTMDAVALQASEYTDAQLRAFQELGMLLRSTDELQRYLQEDPAQPDRYNRLLVNKFINRIYGVASAKKREIAITKLVDDYAMLHNTTGTIDNMVQALGITREQLNQVAASFDNQAAQPMRVIESKERDTMLYTLISRQWVGRVHPFYLLISYTADQLFSVPSGTLAVLNQGQPWIVSGEMDLSMVRDLLSNKDRAHMRRDVPSAIAGISYVYWDEVPVTIRNTSILILMAGVLVLLCTVLVMLAITRRMYSPIADTLSHSGVSLPVGDEFAGLQSAITSLKSDVQTMSQSLGQYHDTVENKFYHDLLTGLVPREQIPERMRELGIPESAGGLYVAVLVQFQETLEPGTDRSHAALFAVRTELRGALQKNRNLLRCVDIDMASQGFIFRQIDTDQLQEFLRGTLLTVEPEFGLETTAFLGEPVDFLRDIHDSFRAALRVSELSVYDAVRPKVITQQSKPKSIGGQHNVSYPLTSEQALIGAVIHGRTSVMESILREVIRTNALECPGNYSPLSLMLTATINRILDGVKRKATDIFDEDTIIYLELRACENYAAMEEKALELFLRLSSYLATEEKKSTQSLEKQMTSFILSNYSRDISLFDLADHVNMSKNYVSTLFRNSTGQTFKDYLGELRHKRAKERIAGEPGIRIHEVAKAVGCSPDTLSRLFMRYSGMSPSDYQQACKNEEVQE